MICFEFGSEQNKAQSIHIVKEVRCALVGTV